MYGMVLMVAVTGSGDTASFGKHKGGCNGDVVSSCDGSGGRSHFRGGCGGGGFLGLRNKGGGCDGGCTGAPAGCTGTVVAAPAPAPVVAAPAPCAAPACDPCAAPACDPCEKKKRVGLFARLCGKHKKADCAPACATAAPACDPCAGAAVVVPPATTTPPVTMPPAVTPKKE